MTIPNGMNWHIYCQTFYVNLRIPFCKSTFTSNILGLSLFNVHTRRRKKTSLLRIL